MNNIIDKNRRAQAKDSEFFWIFDITLTARRNKWYNHNVSYNNFKSVDSVVIIYKSITLVAQLHLSLWWWPGLCIEQLPLFKICQFFVNLSSVAKQYISVCEMTIWLGPSFHPQSWRHDMETFFTLLPSFEERWSPFVFSLIKLLNKQSSCGWFETVGW